MEVCAKYPNPASPLRLLIVCMLSAILLCDTTHAAEPSIYEGDPRYDKVVVEVMLSQPGIEARQQAMLTARANGLALWLDTQMDHLDRVDRNHFASDFEPYTVGTEVIKERSKGLERELDVAVYVDRDKLRFDLASYLFPRHTRPPRVAIILGEEYAGTAGYTVSQEGFAAQLLARFFTEQGFRVVPGQEIAAHFTNDDLMSTLRGGVKPAGRLGRTLNADIVVLGETRTELETPETVGAPKSRAYADVLIVKSGDGSLLDRIAAEAAVSGDDTETSSRRATEDAVYKIQQPAVVAAALGTIQPAKTEYSRLIVRAPNIHNAESAVTRFLKERPLLDNVELLHDGRNELVYDVVCSGKLGSLVRDLEDSTDRGFWLVSRQVVEGNMVFELATRQ